MTVMPDRDDPSQEPVIPTYAGAFRCIGPECEDHCCAGWNIPLDRNTYEAYKSFAPGPLGRIVSEYVFLELPDSPTGMYASIYREPSGVCPFFGSDRLCGIQREYGAELLSATCSIFPRSFSRLDGKLEGSLSLSCPEAARQVLLDPCFLRVHADLLSGAFRTDNVFQPARESSAFGSIRRLLISIIHDRTRSLADRLLLIGSLARQLDRIEEQHLQSLLLHYEKLVQDGAQVPSLNALRANPKLRLSLFFNLTQQLLADPEVSPRFQEIFWTFAEGISTDQGFETNSCQTGGAEGKGELNSLFSRPAYWEFHQCHPHLLENYLINHMLQHLFPYGRSGGGTGSRSCSAQWVLLVLQFSWMETLLIGVAAARGSRFSTGDVVHVVQSFCRATEHNPKVLDRALEELTALQLNTITGMAMLLKAD